METMGDPNGNKYLFGWIALLIGLFSLSVGLVMLVGGFGSSVIITYFINCVISGETMMLLGMTCLFSRKYIHFGKYFDDLDRPIGRLAAIMAAYGASEGLGGLVTIAANNVGSGSMSVASCILMLIGAQFVRSQKTSRFKRIYLTTVMAVMMTLCFVLIISAAVLVVTDQAMILVDALYFLFVATIIVVLMRRDDVRKELGYPPKKKHRRQCENAA